MNCIQIETVFDLETPQKFEDINADYGNTDAQAYEYGNTCT